MRKTAYIVFSIPKTARFVVVHVQTDGRLYSDDKMVLWEKKLFEDGVWPQPLIARWVLRNLVKIVHTTAPTATLAP